MTLFNDTYIKSKISILSEAKKDGTIMNVKVPWSEGGLKNGNGRIYSTELLTREVSRIQKRIDDGALLGQADHPAGNTELKSVSHIVRKMWMEKNIAWANIAILDTTRGKDLKTIIDAGGKLGISSRGFGNIDKKTGVVQNDYMLSNLDVVANPSFTAGTFSKENVFESFDLTEKKTSSSSIAGYSKEGIIMKNKEMVEELREDSEFSRVTKMLYENEEDFTGTLLEYAEKNAMQIKCVLGVENGTWPDYETAYMKLRAGEQMIANGRKMDRTPDRPAEPKDYYEESKITGVDPEKRAENVNKDRNKPAVTERRILLRQRVVLSNPSWTPEKIDEMTEKLLKAEPTIGEESKKERQLLEAEKLEEKQRLKKTKRLRIKQSMYKEGVLAGFTREQMDVAIAKKMAQLDEEELMEV